MTELINQTECAIMEWEYTRTREELNKRVPDIDAINYRRLAYLLIETRRAAYKAAGVKRTLRNVLDEFDVGYDTYYDWREKWYRLLPSNVKNLVR